MIVQSASLESVTLVFRALAHPFRLRLLQELSREEECVCHLAALFGKPQPYVSQQLAELKAAGLTADRRDGQRVFYSVRDERAIALLNYAASLGGCSWRATPQPRRVPDGCACPKCASPSLGLRAS